MKKKWLTNNWLFKKSNREIILFNCLKIKITNKRRKALIGYLFISIWIIGFLWLAAYPLFMSLIYSFQKVIISGERGVVTSNIMFDNYIAIFSQDLEFLNHLQEFVVQLLLYIPIILVVSMIIAMLLNQNIKLRGFFRAIFFLPVVITSGPVINELLSQGAGTIPLIESMDILATTSSFLPAFLAGPLASLFTEIIMILWFSGVQIVLFLAGLQKLNKEIYEAAEIDGASSWEAFWKITLPSMRNIIFVAAIYTTVMLATFSNNKIIRYIQSSNVMFSSDKGFGYSSALAWIYFAVIVILLLVIVLILGERKEKRVKNKQKRRRDR
ncbi:MAG: sugar ABC transporter permease [Acholeplasmataceae bacterium]|jgi:ABC-type sugar transport system permease subunit|nr:sugar ABC transporter permease [Acholeplasmataceae bacterium]